MASSLIARQMPLRQSCLSLPKRSLVAPGVSQVVAFHASAKREILPPLPREFLIYSILFICLKYVYVD